MGFWRFSVSSDLENPSHTYNDYGQYDVELIVESNHGCFDREVTKVLVYPNPIIDFSTEQCVFWMKQNLHHILILIKGICNILIGVLVMEIILILKTHQIHF